jgi:type II secretory pathway component PulC
MNKAILVLTLLCGFLLGVVAGPWIWPRQMAATPAASPPPQAVVVPQPLPPPPPPEPIPPPEPELTLKGVLVGADASRSRALIAQGEDSPRLYKVDEKLPNGYVLKAVNNKDVEIEKNGDTMSLPLVRTASIGTDVEPPQADSAESPPVDTPVAEPTPAEAPTATESPAAKPEQES